MKHIFFLFIVCSSSTLIGQNEGAFFNAMKNSDVVTMESYLEDNIDFCLFEDQQILTKKLALNKLKTFLSGYKIIGIDVIHKGTSKDKTTQYKVAKMITSKDTFRVFVYASGEIGAKTVKEIRIDKF